MAGTVLVDCSTIDHDINRNAPVTYREKTIIALCTRAMSIIKLTYRNGTTSRKAKGNYQVLQPRVKKHVTDLS